MVLLKCLVSYTLIPSPISPVPPSYPSPPHATPANVKVDESPALTDQGEGQEEEEPRMFCGIPQRHYSKSSITLKPRETVASLKLPSITQPDM